MQRLEVPVPAQQIGDTCRINLGVAGSAWVAITTPGGTVFKIPILAFSDIEVTIGSDIQSTTLAINIDEAMPRGPRSVT
ncbi:MAG: hypothetical protein Q7V20_05180 [Aquabacterium sp.]|uniref:hypothetical protein n=1 Tax=Aquabacterium sp. TaxID=1872578 RepID=UPI00271B8B83|nr:hypothetical protein [Aquabacterium sp.]MDO9002827.1 hypothetical protein [Aquabacterium sp.]